jgi:branched-chain amino acid transport system permease protein
MTLDLLVQLIVNGLGIGVIYVLVASGLVLVLGIARVFNFAHGEFYMVGAFVVYFVLTVLHWNFAIGLLIVFLTGGLLGAVTYRVVYHHMRGDLLRCAAASVGISLILKQAALIAFGPSSYGITGVFGPMISVGAVMLDPGRLVVISISLIVMWGLYYLLMRTKTGKAMRAVSLDVKIASLQGINVGEIYLITMVIGSSLAAIAGGIIAPLFIITTEIGHTIILMVFMVMIVGGIESLPGAVLAGMLLGLLESFGYHFFTENVQLFIFCAVAIFLIFRPGGLFGALSKEIY